MTVSFALPIGAQAMTDVVNNKTHHRYELTVDGHLAAAHYQIADGVITFTHTEVAPELGGKGIGSKLIKGALDQVRADGLKVIAECPFVKGYIAKHPEYAGLLKD
jgi:predicted GNAT family acetyltransferase